MLRFAHKELTFIQLTTRTAKEKKEIKKKNQESMFFTCVRDKCITFPFTLANPWWKTKDKQKIWILQSFLQQSQVTVLITDMLCTTEELGTINPTEEVESTLWDHTTSQGHKILRWSSSGSVWTPSSTPSSSLFAMSKCLITLLFLDAAKWISIIFEGTH